MDGFWQAPDYSTENSVADEHRRRTFMRPKQEQHVHVKPTDEELYNRMVDNSWVNRW